MIKLEKEIEQEEKAPEPPPSPISPTQGSSSNKSSSCKKSTGKLLDDAVSMRSNLVTNRDITAGVCNTGLKSIFNIIYIFHICVLQSVSNDSNFVAIHLKLIIEASDKMLNPLNKHLTFVICYVIIGDTVMEQ